MVEEGFGRVDGRIPMRVFAGSVEGSDGAFGQFNDRFAGERHQEDIRGDKEGSRLSCRSCRRPRPGYDSTLQKSEPRAKDRPLASTCG